MSTSLYPGTLDTFVNPGATDTMDGDASTNPALYHDIQHDHINDAVAAIQAALGTTTATGSTAQVLGSQAASQFWCSPTGGGYPVFRGIVTADISVALTMPGPIGGTTPAAGTFTTGAFTSATASSSSVTGAAVVTGGIGIGGVSYFGAAITITDTTASPLSLSGGNAGGYFLKVTNTNAATNVSAGMLAYNGITSSYFYTLGSSFSTVGIIKAGAAGINTNGTNGIFMCASAGPFVVSVNGYAATFTLATNSAITFADNTNTTTPLSYTPGVIGAGHWTFTNTTASTSATTGTIVVSGGVGVSGTITQSITSASAKGVSGTVTATGTSGGMYSVVGNTIYQPSSATTGTFVGVEGITTTVSAANGGVLMGVSAEARVQSGATGTFATAYGIQATVNNQASGSTVSAAYAFFAPTPQATGAIATYYGLYISPITTATTNYAIFTNAGLVSIGDTTTSGGSTTGALVVAGGVGIGGPVYTASNLIVTGNATFGTGGGTSQPLTLVQNANSGVIQYCIGITPGNQTTATSATESQQFIWAAHSIQWATSTPTTQREWFIGAPTYSCNTALQTIASAATIWIDGPPVAGANVALTVAAALYARSNVQTTIVLDTLAASNITGISFYDNGGPKWQTYKDASHNFNIYDSAHGVNFLEFIPGTISAGYLKSSLTLASSSPGTGSFVTAGGIGVGALSYFGAAIGVAGTISINGSGTAFGVTTGAAYIFRSNGTVTPNAGDLVIQSDPTASRGIYFADGTTAALIGQIGGVNPAANSFGGTLIAGRNNAAADTAGFIGETITSTVTAAAAGSTGATANITSISLTAGKWLVTGSATFFGGTTGLTAGTVIQASITTTTAGTGTAGSTMFQNTMDALEASGYAFIAVPFVIVNISATTTYYLTGLCSYTAGSPTIAGNITAVRLP